MQRFDASIGLAVRLVVGIGLAFLVRFAAAPMVGVSIADLLARTTLLFIMFLRVDKPTSISSWKSEPRAGQALVFAVAAVAAWEALAWMLNRAGLH